MSLRRKTVPPTQKHSRSSSSGRKELIAKGKTVKQSVRKRTVLDNRFHRTRGRTRRGPASARRPSRLVKSKTERRRAACIARLTCVHAVRRSGFGTWALAARVNL